MRLARPEDVLIAPDGRFVGPGVSDNGAGLAALMVLGRILLEHPGIATRGGVYPARRQRRGGGRGQPERDAIPLPPGLSARGGSGVPGSGWSFYRPHYGAGTRKPALRNGIYRTRRPQLERLGNAQIRFTRSAQRSPRSRSSWRIEALWNGRRDFRTTSALSKGGSSINSIPSAARAKLDLRSEDPVVLDEMAALLSSAVEAGLERENRGARGARLSAKIKELGSRPGGQLPQDSSLLATIRAVDRHLNIRSQGGLRFDRC